MDKGCRESVRYNVGVVMSSLPLFVFWRVAVLYAETHTLGGRGNISGSAKRGKAWCLFGRVVKCGVMCCGAVWCGARRVVGVETKTKVGSRHS